MSQDFGWFVLIGFLIGFALSTLWEWLYFRSKRMHMENRRVAELEAALRTAQANSGPRPETQPWPAADFQSPAVYLENEGGQAPAAATAGVIAAAAVAQALTDDAEVDSDDSGEAAEPDLESQEPTAEVVLGAAAQQAEDLTHSEVEDDAADLRLAAALAAGATVAAALARDEEPEVAESAELAAVEMTPQTAAVLAATPISAPPAQASSTRESYTANNLSRTEYATLRLIQSTGQSVRKTAGRFGLDRFLPPSTKEST